MNRKKTNVTTTALWKTLRQITSLRGRGLISVLNKFWAKRI